MKPNFALDFRNDAITLLHRTARGWQVVGTVGLDTEDLAGALAYLRTTALELSPKGMTTKLVIPNSQILYTRVQATAQDAGRRRKQVARALEGVTPYPVADLAFDIAGTGPTVDVAVIAKETLAEAEAFATEHRFNPVSFVAVPDNGTFTTEPWFGPTGCVALHVAEGQRVERDTVPIAAPGREGPEHEGQRHEGAVPDMASADVTETAPEADADPVAVPDADLTAEAAQELGTPPEAEPPYTAPQPAYAEPEALLALPPEQASSEPENPAPETEPALAEPPLNAPLAWEPSRQPPDQTPVMPPEDLPHALAEPEPADAQPAARPDLDRAALAEADLEPEEILARIFAVDQADLPDQTAAAAPKQPDPMIPPPTAAATAAAPVQPPPPGQPDAIPVDEAPIALDVVDDLPEETAAKALPGRAGVLDPSIPDDLPPPPPASVMVAFGSRRALEAAAKEAAAKAGTARAGGASGARTATGKAPVLGNVTATRSGPQAKVTTLAPRPPQNSVVRLPQRSIPASGAGPSPDAPADTAKSAGKAARKPSAAGKALRGLGALVTSPGIAGAKERRPVAQIVTPPTGPTSAASAAAATLTRAGAKPYTGGLGARSLQKNKPRYLGLILTGILLVFLALVAAWSTLFLETRNTTAPDPNALVDGTPTVDDEMLADLQGPAEELPPAEAASDLPAVTEPGPGSNVEADAEAEAIAAAVAAAETAPEPVATPEPVSAPEPAPPTALQTEAASAGPLVADPQDEFLLATMDEPPAMPDATSLPPPVARNDAPPGPATPPPPFGTVYQFGADGLIVPTPDGILTPDGVLLFAGRPTREPPPRPASVTAAAAAATAPADGQSAATPQPALAPEAFVADPALAGARPRARPEGLTPPTVNADDGASLAPAAGSRFASLRPRTKPAGLVEVAAETAATVQLTTPGINPPANPIADLGAQGASLTAQANATAAVAAGAAGPLTLTVSRKPAPRPKDLSRAVEAAVAVASRQPDPTPPVEEPTAKTEPEADGEPEIATAMPRLPTKTTVAKQATFVNAINLSKINLIGVYGSASDRYALIRQTNGRYKKVKVGDSIDGGRVAAITTSELRYKKSGKMVTLALPKG